MTLHYQDDRATVYHGDCVEVMRTLADNSVDAVVTDPPYGLEFMGKEWDAPWKDSARWRSASKLPGSHSTQPTPRPQGWGDAGLPFQQWSQVWATEALRVLKPGGHLLAFGGTRTWHRLAVAIEDAGFEVRDSIAWMYGSGFPKSLDVSKAIDKAAGAEREVIGVGNGGLHHKATVTNLSKWNVDHNADSHSITAPATPAAQQWQGWGTALKPAFEPIVVARKPLIGTVAENVQTHGVGGLNIDGCRIGTEERTNPPGSTNPRIAMGDHWRADATATTATGRWPANVILDESQAAELDKQSGVTSSGQPNTNIEYGQYNDRESSGIYGRGLSSTTPAQPPKGDTGGASRFFYCPKASTAERPREDGVAHPTVKPLRLMEYLCRLVTPPGGTILEPFAGSGTTIEAALNEGFNVIGIEMTDEYLPLIIERIERYGEKLW